MLNTYKCIKLNNSISNTTTNLILKSFFSTKLYNSNNSNRKSNSNDTNNQFEKFKGNKDNNNLKVIKLPTYSDNNNNNNSNISNGLVNEIPILERKKLIKKEKKQEVNKTKKENELLKKKLESLEKQKKKILNQIEEYDETPDALKLLFDSNFKKNLVSRIKKIENQENEIKLIQQQEQEQEQQQQQQNDTSSVSSISSKPVNEIISEKDFNTMKLLFGEKYEDEIMNKNGSNDIIDTVVEFTYQDQFYIGVVKNISLNQVYQVERLVVNSGENQNQDYSIDIVYINESDIIFYWKELFGKMNIKELVELDSSYHSFKFQTNILNDNKLSLFKNKYEFTTDQVAKVLYNIQEPNKKQLYSTFKYLSSSDNVIKPKDGRLGYEFLQFDNKEILESFINKTRIVLDSNNKNNSKDNIIDQFNYQDIYYLNLIKLLSISPQKTILPDQHAIRILLRELGYGNSQEGASKLLKDIGFLNKVPETIDSSGSSSDSVQNSNNRIVNNLYNKNMGLWTKELYEYSNTIENQPNQIQDVLSSVRVSFDKPAISIDPSSTLGIDDALSIDCDSSDKFNIVYIHISDFIRWMPDGIDNILYKSALVNLKTWYPPNGAYHMFPPPLVKTLSLSNATKDNPICAITIEINFEKSTSKIDSYRIYPTRISSVIPLSESIVTLKLEPIIKQQNGQQQEQQQQDQQQEQPQLNNEEEKSLSLGENLLLRLYEFTKKRQEYRKSSNTSLESYGRVNLYKKELKVKQKHGSKSNDNFDIDVSSLTQKTSYHSLGHEIVDEILSAVDDVCTEIYQSKGIYGFYKYFGQPNYKRVSPKSSFLTLTSPIRNFTHLFTQLQLKNLLLKSNANTKDPNLFFSWDYTSTIGDQVIKTIRLKKNYQINLINYVLLKAIQNDIQKQKDRNIKDKNFKPVLEGSVLSINPSNFQFAIHLKKFQYSTNCSFTIQSKDNNSINSKKLPFRVNDIVEVSVESLDLEDLTLKLNFLKLKKRIN